jgi:hypothetical protein
MMWHIYSMTCYPLEAYFLMCRLGEELYGHTCHHFVIFGHFVAYVGKKTKTICQEEASKRSR